MNNPYESPAVESGKLDRNRRIQAAVLRIYMKYRGSELPTSHLLGMYVRRWLGTIAVLVCLLLLLSSLGSEIDRELVSVLMGIMLGMMLRDFSVCRTTSRLWPFTCEILDWEKVEQQFQELN